MLPAVKPSSFRRTLSVLALACALALPVAAQSPSDLPEVPKPMADEASAATLRNTPRNFLKDQAAIWTSPLHLNESNAAGPIVLGLATTVAITTDHQAMTSSRLQDATLNKHAETASNGLVGALVVVPAALFGIGYLRHNPHAAETGLLSGEAIADSLVVNEVMKVVSMRERPTADSARGKFFQSSVGIDSSFPSNHSIIAWSSAAVIASEYPGWLTQLSVYGMATGVSVTRVVARQHFPSDVLVGSAVGWMIGRYVFRHHQRTRDLSVY